MSLAMDAQQFRQLGHSLVDEIAQFLESLPERPVNRADSPDDVRAAIASARALPERGESPERLLAATSRALFEGSLFNGHPRFFGYITASPAPIGILGDLLASAVNANVGAWRLAPVASEIEAQAVRWIAELIGYPRDCGGLFVSGGNMANFVGLLAARAAQADWNVRTHGVAGGRTLRLYASGETHTWVQKAADLAGLGTDAIRWLPTDTQLRLDVTALRAAIAQDRAAGDLPFMVVGTAGSVSTGAVDPLAEIAQVCRTEHLWFHVDGAYGALAACAAEAPPELAAMAEADSVAVDPHKWLYAPLEAGCVLVRDAEHLRAAFSYHPPYYHFGQAANNYVDFGPQNSRGFRALKVWLALQHAGRSGYAERIGTDMRLSERLWDRVQAHPELEACTQGLSITTFRYVPAGLDAAAEGDYLNRLNEALLERIQCSGELFVSNAVVNGNYLLRACVVNLNTREADIDAIPEIVVRLGRDLHAELLRAHPSAAVGGS